MNSPIGGRTFPLCGCYNQKKIGPKFDNLVYFDTDKKYFDCSHTR